ncbi:MAG: PEP-utilizing enzyme [Acidimicrobiales bacterium]
MATTRRVSGISVALGRGSGELRVDVDDALDAMDGGRPVVLALAVSSPADVPAMIRASAVVAASGDAQSHTAIIANAAGVPAVVVPGLTIGADGIEVDGTALEVGHELTVDGDAGTVEWRAP